MPSYVYMANESSLVLLKCSIYGTDIDLFLNVLEFEAFTSELPKTIMKVSTVLRVDENLDTEVA